MKKKSQTQGYIDVIRGKKSRKKTHYRIPEDKGITLCGRFGAENTTVVEAFTTCKDCKKYLEKWHKENV
ncbi:MAG: hypothetical protein FVQ80_11195 [Planctomycetes bacterium]|nr:hypothetical protein [Planctomycetota bacterium]